MSFGVGGNSEKRLSDAFEQDLLRAILDDGCTVVLDKGVGEEEVERAGQLTETVRASGVPVLELSASTGVSAGEDEMSGARLITWHGGIGVFSALTAECDEYVGYDSSGQHVAAALGVPTISIFTRIAPAIFRDRWKPAGPNVSKIVSELDSEGVPRPAHAVLEGVIQIHREISIKPRA